MEETFTLSDIVDGLYGYFYIEEETEEKSTNTDETIKKITRFIESAKNMRQRGAI